MGIGTYYIKGEVISQDEVNNLLIAAHENIRKRNEANDNAEILAKAEREAKIEIGRKLVNIPAGAVAVLIGQFRIDKSDPHSDYSHYPVETIIFLAYSTHTKDMFTEFRKAAANSEDTKHLVDADEEMERREKYSMGRGYYLGPYGAGWSVSKMKLIGHKETTIDERTKENLYIAAAEGRYFCNVATESSETEQPAPSINAETNLQLYSYSEKAIAVIGDTKAVKDLLKSLGGKFNFALKQPGSEKRTPGWIFSKKQEPAVRAALNL
jgi:hypothetical protein